MNEAERKLHIRKTFDSVSEHYDCHALRYFAHAAARLPELFAFRGDEQVLDVACGTGTPALVLAPHVPTGQVTGIDASPGMLAVAQRKLQQSGFNNVCFQQQDMTALPFSAGTFDAVNCSFGIFFIEDMPALIRHITRTIKPGGQLITTHFYQGAFAPLSELFLARVESYGIELPPIGWKRLASEEQNVALFKQAGLTAMTTQRQSVGYYLQDEQAWWDVVWNAGYRGLLNSLDEGALAQFKAEHLAEIAQYQTAQGIALDIDVIYTRGRVA